MKRIFEWLKVRTMPVMLVLCGIVYLAFYDDRDLYGMADIRNAIAEAGEQYDAGDEMVSGNEIISGNGMVSGNEGGTGRPDMEAGAQPGADEGGADSLGGNPVGDNAEGNMGNERDPDIQPVFRNPEDVVYGTVTEDYFSDAVFIGDSRTVGMYEYGGLEDIAAFYASTGLTVYKMFDADIVDIPGQKERANIEQMLTENSFSKIYLMIGINEMGTGTVDSFMEKYAECLEHLRELQPDAVIYIQAIMKVTEERSQQGDYITNEGIDERNERLKGLANNVNIYYLDVNPLICDETGGMIASYTSDGVHLKAKYIDIWKQFLMEHAVMN